MDQRGRGRPDDPAGQPRGTVSPHHHQIKVGVVHQLDQRGFGRAGNHAGLNPDPCRRKPGFGLGQPLSEARRGRADTDHINRQPGIKRALGDVVDGGARRQPTVERHQHLGDRGELARRHQHRGRGGAQNALDIAAKVPGGLIGGLAALADHDHGGIVILRRNGVDQMALMQGGGDNDDPGALQQVAGIRQHRRAALRHQLGALRVKRRQFLLQRAARPKPDRTGMIGVNAAVLGSHHMHQRHRDSAAAGKPRGMFAHAGRIDRAIDQCDDFLRHLPRYPARYPAIKPGADQG